MSRIAILGLAIALAACQPTPEAAAPTDPAVTAAQTGPDEAAREAEWTRLEDRYLAVNVRPADPIDAVEWTEVRCNFLAGEFGGDNSAQDRAINARMEELGCGEPMRAEARSLRASRATDTATVARLDALLARHED